jgi:hypothetical protein
MATPLRDMLAAAAECQDLRSIGKTNIILEMTRAVATGASLIDEYMRPSLLGECFFSVS